MELMKRDSLKGSGHTPIHNHHILPLITLPIETGSAHPIISNLDTIPLINQKISVLWTIG